jgi:hypothetical protein
MDCELLSKDVEDGNIIIMDERILLKKNIFAALEKSIIIKSF